MKRLPPAAALAKNERELLQIYASTGLRLGFTRRSLVGTLRDLAAGLCLATPRAAFDSAKYHLQLAIRRRTFRRRARNIAVN
jgi:hypothetical protein